MNYIKLLVVSATSLACLVATNCCAMRWVGGSVAKRSADASCGASQWTVSSSNVGAKIPNDESLKATTLQLKRCNDDSLESGGKAEGVSDRVASLDQPISARLQELVTTIEAGGKLPE